MTGQVHQGDVNGVPAFWVDSGRPTLTASLIARQGMVDETFATSGWTHLLEHVALHDRGRGRLEVNGSVSLLHTRFDAHGPADQVAALFTSLAQWLSAPEFDDLERERSVLRAEAAVRGAGDTARALVWRYGAQGPGLAGFAEPGLAQATPARLAELGAQVFVRENCALVLDGPPPRELRLGLDPGGLRPPPAASPCGHALPGAYLIPSGVVVSGVVPRTTAATVLAQVLQAQFTAEFRERHASAYAPWAHYEPVDDEHAVVLAGSDANHVLRQTVVRRALDQVERLARGTIPTAVVMDTMDRLVQAMSDPYHLPALAHRAAMGHLRGEAVMSLEDCIEEVRAVRFADVAEAAEALRGSLLMGVGGDSSWRDELPFVEMPTRPRLPNSSSHRSRNFPAVRERLVVGPTAVQMGAAETYRTIHREGIVGLLVHPDGGREVIDRDGWTISVEPTLWRRGDVAASAVDALVAPDLHLARPDRGPHGVPRPAGTMRCLMFVSREHGARLRHQLPLIALVVFALALGLGAIVFHVYTLGLLVGVLTLGQLRRRATRQRQRL